MFGNIQAYIIDHILIDSALDGQNFDALVVEKDIAIYASGAIPTYRVEIST